MGFGTDLGDMGRGQRDEIQGPTVGQAVGGELIPVAVEVRFAQIAAIVGPCVKSRRFVGKTCGDIDVPVGVVTHGFAFFRRCAVKPDEIADA